MREKRGPCCFFFFVCWFGFLKCQRARYELKPTGFAFSWGRSLVSDDFAAFATSAPASQHRAERTKIVTPGARSATNRFGGERGFCQSKHQPQPSTSRHSDAIPSIPGHTAPHGLRQDLPYLQVVEGEAGAAVLLPPVLAAELLQQAQAVQPGPLQGVHCPEQLQDGEVSRGSGEKVALLREAGDPTGPSRGAGEGYLQRPGLCSQALPRAGTLEPRFPRAEATFRATSLAAPQQPGWPGPHGTQRFAAGPSQGAASPHQSWEQLPAAPPEAWGLATAPNPPRSRSKPPARPLLGAGWLCGQECRCHPSPSQLHPAALKSPTCTQSPSRKLRATTP